MWTVKTGFDMVVGSLVEYWDLSIDLKAEGSDWTGTVARAF